MSGVTKMAKTRMRPGRDASMALWRLVTSLVVVELTGSFVEGAAVGVQGEHPVVKYDVAPRTRRQGMGGMGMGGGGECATPYSGSCLDACGAYASNGGWDNTYDACGNKARLTSLTLRYLGTNVNDLGALRGFLPVGPDGTQKQPDSKLEITSPGPNHVSPVTISNGGGLTVTPNSVSIGSTFTLSGSFPGDLTMQISHGSSSWTVEFHSSCSYPLEVGDAYGSLRIVAHTNTLNCSSNDFTTTTPAPTTAPPPPTRLPTRRQTLPPVTLAPIILPQTSAPMATPLPPTPSSVPTSPIAPTSPTPAPPPTTTRAPTRADLPSASTDPDSGKQGGTHDEWWFLLLPLLLGIGFVRSRRPTGKGSAELPSMEDPSEIPSFGAFAAAADAPPIEAVPVGTPVTAINPMAVQSADLVAGGGLQTVRPPPAVEGTTAATVVPLPLSVAAKSAPSAHTSGAPAVGATNGLFKSSVAWSDPAHPLASRINALFNANVKLNEYTDSLPFSPASSGTLPSVETAAANQSPDSDITPVIPSGRAATQATSALNDCDTILPPPEAGTMAVGVTRRGDNPGNPHTSSLAQNSVTPVSANSTKVATALRIENTTLRPGGDLADVGNTSWDAGDLALGSNNVTASGIPFDRSTAAASSADHRDGNLTSAGGATSILSAHRMPNSGIDDGGSVSNDPMVALLAALKADLFRLEVPEPHLALLPSTTKAAKLASKTLTTARNTIKAAALAEAQRAEEGGRAGDATTALRRDCTSCNTINHANQANCKLCSDTRLSTTTAQANPAPLVSGQNAKAVHKAKRKRDVAIKRAAKALDKARRAWQALNSLLVVVRPELAADSTGRSRSASYGNALDTTTEEVDVSTAELANTDMADATFVLDPSSKTLRLQSVVRTNPLYSVQCGSNLRVGDPSVETMETNLDYAHEEFNDGAVGGSSDDTLTHTVLDILQPECVEPDGLADITAVAHHRPGMGLTGVPFERAVHTTAMTDAGSEQMEASNGALSSDTDSSAATLRRIALPWTAASEAPLAVVDFAHEVPNSDTRGATALGSSEPVDTACRANNDTSA